MIAKTTRVITEYYVTGFYPGSISIKFDPELWSKTRQRRTLKAAGKLNGAIYGLAQAKAHAKEIRSGSKANFQVAVVKEVRRIKTIYVVP